ncbi:beta/gamma crystallin-related protein [Hyphobacterium sp.]|uniref:beta/gamma crystallin-related protein n=1 Tax=Hyphobacterium sp. TaxID=2004662 RepID=UPI003748154F
MKLLMLKACALAGLMLAIPASIAGAQSPQASRIASIILWDGPNFTGRAVTVRVDQDGSNLVNLNFNDRASSIQVAGDWQVCEHVNYGGECRRFSGDAASLGSFDNRISSVRFLQASAPPQRPTVPPSGTRPVDAPRTGIRLFDSVGYFGDRYDAPTDVSNLRSSGFNDRASSLAIAAGEVWEVCVDANYGSRCQRLGSSIPDLSIFSLDNTISSMRRVGGGPTTPQRPQVPGNGFDPQRPAFLNVTGESRGEGGVLFFAVPRVNGSAVDHCANASMRTCGDSGADLICEIAGAREAAGYTVADPRQYGGTVHVESGTQCRGGNCGAIVNLLCSAN